MLLGVYDGVDNFLLKEMVLVLIPGYFLNFLQALTFLRGTIVVADNVEIYKNEMQDYLEYVRNSTIYESKTIETTVEFTPNVKDAMEVSIKVRLTK